MDTESTSVTLGVNGEDRSVEATAKLLGVLRSQMGLTGVKPGCGEGACGSCTVLVDGQPVKACQHQAGEFAGQRVTTVEGLVRAGRLHPVQQAFAEIGAAQCGYCTPGMIMASVALLERVPDPSLGAIDEALAGNVCRCGSYPQIRRAVRRAVELAAAAGSVDPAFASAASDRRAIPDPATPRLRPARPWDMTDPEECEWFDVLGDGLMVVLVAPPLEPGTWTTGGGAWLHVTSDGVVSAFTGKVDVGQDNCTALRLLVAEGLKVPLASVRLAMGDTDLCPYDMGTFGSRSMPDAGSALAKVAAFARSVLPAAAGERRLELVTGDPDVTRPSDWRVAGKAHVPEGMLDAVTGSRRFVSDLTMPGLRHGAVLRPPVLGATLLDIDASGLADFAGAQLVRTHKLTGVVADSLARARLALASLKVEWELPDAPSRGDLEAFLRSHPVSESGGWAQASHDEQGDPDAVLAASEIRIQATYATAYIAPAALETRAALAVWDDERLMVWVGTQTPFATRAQVAAELDVPEERVRVIVPPTGGGFGGKHGGGVALEAAVLAREVGAPVKVAWSRHEEFTAGTLRPAAVIDVDASVASDGKLTAWTFTNINSGSAAIGIPYEVANRRLEYRPSASPLLQASYRALAATANNFARESHIDELVHRLGMDPVEFRVRNLDDARLVSVLTSAAERFGWRSWAGAGQGIALGLEKGGRVATAVQVAEFEGRLEVVRIVTAYECGAVVNPRTVINQIEGATIMALGGALFEAIEFTSGLITNGSFSDYRVPRFSDVPPIDVVLLDRPDLASAGAGETPMICVAPAIANAVYDLTGRRLRSLPLDLVIETGSRR
jgi:isoquinoline 1-oxidoreductase